MESFQLQNQSLAAKSAKSKPKSRLQQAELSDELSQDAADDFLSKLQTQAKMQARLDKKRILPHQVDSLASFVGRYSWQSLLIVSLITTILLEVVF